jgi:UDP-N-acetylglucosamine 4,6-dehydratase
MISADSTRDLRSMLKDATILLTGGTGSFGNKFVEMTLKHFPVKKIIVFSRDEMKQYEMGKRFQNDARLRFFLGDIRDKDRLFRAASGVDFIVHAAALKIVPFAEYNPLECIKTNVNGAMNLVDCAIDCKVKRVVALSTDKACNPVNLYGATKLCSDKLFVAGNAYVGSQDTRFSVVRYGNVMGSRGSIIPHFLSLRNAPELPITDERMTRFMITLEQGVEMVWKALEDSRGGEIYVRKIPSMKITDIAKVIAPSARLNIVGIRPGEKIHEQMISTEDARSTLEFRGYFKIIPQLELPGPKAATVTRLHGSAFEYGTPCQEGFSYSSDTNTSWMSPETLRAWLAPFLDRPQKHQEDTEYDPIRETMSVSR